MIFTKIKGGLGNQMFQYACGRAVSLKRKDTLKLDISGYINQSNSDTSRAYRLSYFNLSDEIKIATPEEITSVMYPYGICSRLWQKTGGKILKKIFKRYYIDYHPEILELGKVGLNDTSNKSGENKRNIYLDGFFQSEKYFLDIREVILKDLELISTVRAEVSPTFLEFESLIKSKPWSISLHVRRGDYVTNAHAFKTHFVDLTEYYKRSISVISKKMMEAGMDTEPHFFVFSDDITWVRQNMNIPGNATYIVCSNGKNLEDYEELTLMSFCKNNIIANSSFSWWGAWLNRNSEKIVIAPKQWTAKNTENPNIIPETWIKL